MPLSLTMYPNSFPEVTLKVLVLGFSLIELFDHLKESLKRCQLIYSISGFHYHVVCINLDILMHHVM